VQLEVVPGVELDSEHLADGLCATLEAAHTADTTATIPGAIHTAQRAHFAVVGEDTVVVSIMRSRFASRRSFPLGAHVGLDEALVEAPREQHRLFGISESPYHTT